MGSTRRQAKKRRSYDAIEPQRHRDAETENQLLLLVSLCTLSSVLLAAVDPRPAYFFWFSGQQFGQGNCSPVTGQV